MSCYSETLFPFPDVVFKRSVISRGPPCEIEVFKDELLQRNIISLSGRSFQAKCYFTGPVGADKIKFLKYKVFMR